MCTVSNIFACISPFTKNVGAILIQNEDLNAYRLHITDMTLSVTQCMSKWYYNYYSVQNRVVYRPQSMQMQHGQ